MNEKLLKWFPYRLKVVKYSDKGKKGTVRVGKETYLYNPAFNQHLEK